MMESEIDLDKLAAEGDKGLPEEMAAEAVSKGDVARSLGLSETAGWKEIKDKVDEITAKEGIIIDRTQRKENRKESLN